MNKNLGGNTTERADPNLPKGYSIAYDVMVSNKKKKSVWELSSIVAIVQRLAEHCSA